MWNELVTTALIGTERRAFTLDSLPEALRDLAAQVEGEDAERTLLTLAGTMALYRRAGQTPQIDPSPLPEPSKLDTLPPCSPRAGLTLQQILALSQHGQYLGEWIAAAYNTHQRIPPEYLPRLLMAFEKNSRLPDHFYDVLGERGRWLAHQNPAWSYAAVPETDAEWELADINARDAYLRQLRAADPAHARAVLESVWKGENAETRALLIKTFKLGLRLDDEAFLEAALDDRADSVRMMAAWLLAQLSGSAYQKRMIGRAQPLIQIERKRNKLNIAVNLPDHYDKSMLRDRIPVEPTKDSNLPNNVYVLTNIVSWLPSTYWLSGDWSGREMVEAVSANHNWHGLFLGCLAQIAERENQHDLADALLEAEINEQDELSALRAARPAAREAYGLRALDWKINDQFFKHYVNLGTVGHDWSVNLTRAFLARAKRDADASAGAGLAYSRYLSLYAMKMSPTCLDDLRALQPEDRQNNPIWSRAVKEAVATLEFRQKMLKEFSR